MVHWTQLWVARSHSGWFGLAPWLSFVQATQLRAAESQAGFPGSLQSELLTHSTQRSVAGSHAGAEDVQSAEVSQTLQVLALGNALCAATIPE